MDKICGEKSGSLGLIESEYICKYSGMFSGIYESLCMDDQ